MNFLRVILATCVIFAAGGLSGYYFAKQPTDRDKGGGDNRGREEMRARMQRDLQATGEQMIQLDRIFAESKQRSNAVKETIRGPLDLEVNRVQEQIRGVLNPEQAVKYEELLKNRNRHRGPKAGGTNATQSCQIRFPSDRRSRS